MITDEQFVRANLPNISADSDKYTRGHLLVAAGSYGMAGAAILCIRAAFASGVGYVSALMPESIYPIITMAVPEAVCMPYSTSDENSFRRQFDRAVGRCDAVVFGPGVGALRDCLAAPVFETEKPLLIDADGLNALASLASAGNTPELHNAVLTPHEGECARLLQTTRRWVHENRAEAVRRASAGFYSSVLLKGPKTLIFDVRTGFDAENSTGCEALGRAGSGDVLSGLIGGLMAQGVQPAKASAMSAYLHGLAGDRCKQKLGVRGTMPSDLIIELKEILKEQEAEE